MSTKDHYKTLGIDRDEDQEGVRRAFRRLAKDCHPDCAGPGGTERFHEIAEAHEVLSDPGRRRDYDADLNRCEREERSFDARPGRRGGAGWPSAEPMTSGAGVTSPWAEPMRPFHRPSRAPRDPGGLWLELTLSPEEARRGGSLPLSWRRFERCPACGGVGRERWFPCPTCGGRGAVATEGGLELRVPSGVLDGAWLRGRLSRAEGGALDVRVRIRIDGWA